MRSFVGGVLFLVACGCAVAEKPGDRMRVSLINLTADSKQVDLPRGVLLELPVGRRVDVLTQEGSRLHLVNVHDRRFDEMIPVQAGDDLRLIEVH